MIDLSFLNTISWTKTTVIYITDVVVIFLAIMIIYKWIRRQKKISNNLSSPNNDMIKPKMVITSKDIRAIAGDDVMITQLDLARAYIELGKKKLAKQILDHVLKHGNPNQQQAARQLMASI